MKQLFLIDGSGFIFRAFHALPPLTATDGAPVGAVYGFCNMLRNLIAAHKQHHFLVVFDAGRQTFRQTIYPDYKAHRPPAPEELVPQFPLIHEACEMFGIPFVDMEGYEADDLIASYAKQGVENGFEVTIVSADKDLMQLITPSIKLFDPMKRKAIGPVEVMEKFGVTPDKVIDVQALAGDAADNVPGVPGIGVKTAAELINTFNTLEILLEQAHTIKQPKRRQNLIDHANAARISKELVTLVDSLPLPLDFDALFVKDVGPETIDFLNRMGFKTLTQRVQTEVNALALSKPHLAKPSTLSPTTVNEGNTHTSPSDRTKDQVLINVGEVEAYLKNAMQSGIVAFDCETTSLHIHEASLVGCSFAFEDDNGIIHPAYIPFHHQTSAQQASWQEICPLLKAFLENPGVLKVGHNLKYDMGILKNLNIDILGYDDTMLMSYCLYGGLHSHSLGYLSEHYLKLATISYESICGTGKNQKTFDHVPLQEATAYACEDAELTLKLYKLFKPQLISLKVSTLYHDIERPLLPSIVAMEHKGIIVDKAELQACGLEVNARLQTLEDEIYKIVGHTFNIGAPKQLGVVLFEEMSLPSPKFTKTGVYVTDADVLEGLSKQGFEIATKLLEWRSLSKLLSTYIEALPKEISAKTGRIHTSYALSGTATGRLSSSNPNLQNIPIKTEDGKRIRKAFVAQAGYVLMSFDYSQIELRLLAHFADIAPLTNAFQNNIDSHTATASLLYDTPYETVTPEQRRNAKTVNFGIIYGISAYGLSNQLNIPQTQASLLIKAYLNRYPGVETFMEQQKGIAAAQGYVTTLCGRRCYTPGIHDKNTAIRQFAMRQAVNAPLQGSNADIIKLAMIRIQHYLEKSKVDAHLLLQVHDELVFEVKDEVQLKEQFTKEIISLMENVIKLKVPLKVEMGEGKNWQEAH